MNFVASTHKDSSKIGETMPVAFLRLQFLSLLFLGIWTTAYSFVVPCSLDARVGFLAAMAGRAEGGRDLNPADSEGVTRRELLSWGPTMAAALSTATISPDAALADTPQENALLKPQIPFSSSRQYRSTRLSNGLRVLLVSDKRAVRAGVALSIAGAGQFSDPEDLPGCAHLAEHMILSSTSSGSRLKKSEDFEDWLSETGEGASNAFTGYEQVCFHFNSRPGVVSEALVRFATLFNEPDFIKVCQDETILRREIRRVAAELDFESESIQSSFLMKDMMNPKHPYSRFARGNIDSLERIPNESGINVGQRLIQFYQDNYQPPAASLVVVAPYELNSLERWVTPFGTTLSRKNEIDRLPRVFPTEALKSDKRLRQILLYRPKVDFPLKTNIETLSMHWALDLDYNERSRGGRSIVTAAQVGFVLSQIFGRRGPGSLYYNLYQRGYLPQGKQGVPRISFPVDVSGFQLLKLDILLTPDGFVNRAVVVGHIFKAIESVFSGEMMIKFLVSRQILSQYAVVAQLHGYTLAPRPPDAVELAADAMANEDDPTRWSRFPLATDRFGLVSLQRVVKDTLLQMSDPSNAVVITTATDRALSKARQSTFMGETVPALLPSKWHSARLTGAKYYKDDSLFRFTGIVGELLAGGAEEEELLPPLTNNLIPPTIRPPRALQQLVDVNQGRSDNWRLLQPDSSSLLLRIPRIAPEASCRCTFVFQLLSPRPARAKTRQAAYAELWKVSFEKSIVDLAELGVPAGLAYDMSFNKLGMRLCFLGISQNLPSYCRRFCRRLVQHHKDLLRGAEKLDESVTETALVDAMRAQGVSALRKREIENVLLSTTAYEAATEAIAFYKSCRGGCAFSQGDLLPGETAALFDDLKGIFKQELGTFGKSDNAVLIPSIDDLVYTPVWKPRFGSSCNVPGIQLLSDACGRVPR